jgi:hypothetical protein
MLNMLFFLLLAVASAYYVCTDSITKVHYDSKDLPVHYPTHMKSTKEGCNTECGPCSEIGEVRFGYTAWCNPSALQVFFHELKKTNKKVYKMPLPTHSGTFEDTRKHPFIFHSYMCLYEEEDEDKVIVPYQKRYSNERVRPLPTVMMQIPR